LIENVDTKLGLVNVTTGTPVILAQHQVHILFWKLDVNMLPYLMGVEGVKSGNSKMKKVQGKT
jgi:hypothetical protein